MSKYNKIYVIAPHKIVTGGVELAHQLVDYLNNQNENSFIVYVDEEQKIIPQKVNITTAYSKYNIKTSNIIDDSPYNILVLPEVYFDFILQYKYIQIGCWWMSVDNRYKSIVYTEKIKHEKGLINKIKLLYSHFISKTENRKNKTSDLYKNRHRIIHFYQSHYALQHLNNLGFENKMPLSDYINIELFNNTNLDLKEDIILYNPSKGYSFTKKIIDKLPSHKFIALKGYSRQELSELFGRAKLYIDFGHFPGKDRLPREAVINNCCIITGKEGASFYYEDVPINEKYKFDIKEQNIESITEMIKYVLINYEKCNKDFQSYRNIIKKEHDIFNKEIEAAFIF